MTHLSPNAIAVTAP